MVWLCAVWDPTTAVLHFTNTIDVPDFLTWLPKWEVGEPLPGDAVGVAHIEQTETGIEVIKYIGAEYARRKAARENNPNLYHQWLKCARNAEQSRVLEALFPELIDLKQFCINLYKGYKKREYKRVFLWKTQHYICKHVQREYGFRATCEEVLATVSRLLTEYQLRKAIARWEVYYGDLLSTYNTRQHHIRKSAEE